MVGSKKRAPMARTVMCGLALMVLGATDASAAIYEFNFSDGLYFRIESTDPIFAIDTGELRQIGYTYNGSNYTFTNTTDMNGLSFGDFSHAEPVFYNGTQLYSGSESNPVFSPGSYSLTQYLGGAPVTVSISAVGPGGPAPEVGVGVLAAIAAGLALTMTRMRRPKRARSMAPAYA